MFNVYQSKGCFKISKETGITGITLILTLSILQVLESFPLNVIHLFYQGVVSRILVPLFSELFWRDLPANSDDNEMRVPTLV